MPTRVPFPGSPLTLAIIFPVFEIFICWLKPQFPAPGVYPPSPENDTCALDEVEEEELLVAVWAELEVEVLELLEVEVDEELELLVEVEVEELDDDSLSIPIPQVIVLLAREV